MKTGEFWEHCQSLKSTSGRHATRDQLADIISENDTAEVQQAISLMVGDPFVDPELSMGVGKKTVREAVKDSFVVSHDYLREREKELGSLTQAVDSLDRPTSLTDKRYEYGVRDIGELIRDIALESGENRKTSMISEALTEHEYPQVVVFAVLSPRKDMSLGMSWKTVRDACVKIFPVTKPNFERAYGITGHISPVLRDLKEGYAVKNALEPGDPIKPQLASSRDLPQNTEGWVAQTKYDGGRLLIHKREGKPPMAYTRQQHEISANLPELEEIPWPEDDFIIDTEAVGYDTETGELLSFQQFMERFQREKNVAEKAKEVEIQFRVFDLLYWNGDMTQYPFKTRFGVLEKSFDRSMVADTHTDLYDAYERALEEGHEGIIGKERDHEYEFHRRSTWRKMKPTKEPVELIISGVVAGTGERAGGLGSLKLKTADGHDIGKVGTGLTDADLKKLWEMYEDDALLGRIAEIKFEEFQERDGRYGLRFPRYEGLRPDGEADTLERIRNL